MAGKMKSGDPSDCFYGTVSVGERGQVVIPAEARKALNIGPGDKLLIMGHPSGKGLVLIKMDAMREFMNQMLATLEHAERSVGDAPEQSATGENVPD